MKTNRILTLLLLFFFIFNNYASSQKIFRAVKKGSIYSVTDCIKEGNDINVTNSDNETALIVASRAGYGHIVKVLIANGANLNHKNNQGQTALIIACKNKDDYTAKILIKEGANIDLQDNQGQTALHIAVEWGDILTVRSLIEHGADVDILDADGIDAYSIALKKQKSLPIREFFRYGIVDSSLRKYISPIFYGSADKLNPNVVKMTIRGDGIDDLKREYFIKIDNSTLYPDKVENPRSNPPIPFYVRLYAYLTAEIKHNLELDFWGSISWEDNTFKFSLPVSCQGVLKIEFIPKENKEYLLLLESNNSSGISSAKMYGSYKYPVGKYSGTFDVTLIEIENKDQKTILSKKGIVVYGFAQ